MQQRQHLFELNLQDKKYKYTSLSLLHPKCDVCQFFDAHGYKQSHMTQVPWLSVLLPRGLNPVKRNKPLVPKSTGKATCYVKHSLHEGNWLKLTVESMLRLINRAGGLYGRILTEVVSTNQTQWGLFSQMRSCRRSSHTDWLSSVNKMFIIC